MRTGVFPFGAQVALTEGRRLNPLSSWKTIHAPRPGRFFYPGPAFVDPLLDRLVVPLGGTTGRTLASPSHLAKHSPDVTGVVLHPGDLFDHVGHSSQGPQLGREAVGLGSLCKARATLAKLASLTLGGRPG